MQCVPVKVVLKAPQALGGAEVLVQVPLSVTRRQVLLSSAQDDSLPAAADLSRRHVHAQLRQEERRVRQTHVIKS